MFPYKAEPVPIFERMMRRVKRDPETGCLNFTGAKDGGGYGQVSVGRGKAPAKTHRISYEHHFGEVPAGYVVCHNCDNPACIEPTHLRADTQKENVRDIRKRGRANPTSLLNLRPGHRGFHGAGPISKGEIQRGTRY